MAISRAYLTGLVKNILLMEEFDIHSAFDFIKKKEGRALPKKYIFHALKNGDIEKLNIPEDLGDDKRLNFIYKFIYEPHTLTKEDLHFNGNLYLRDFVTLTHLPDNLYVRENLVLRGCTSLKELPTNFFVGGNIVFKASDPIPQRFDGNIPAIRKYINSLGGKVAHKIYIKP